MAAITVTVDDANARVAFANLREVAAGDPKVMRQISLALKQEVYNAFRFQRSPLGVQWPGLSPLTLAARARKGNNSQQPLIATGDMHKSIEPDSTDTSAGITVGAGLPDARAWYNQFGTLTAPARPFLPMTTSGAALPQAWLDAVSAPVREALEKAVA